MNLSFHCIAFFFILFILICLSKFFLLRACLLVGFFLIFFLSFGCIFSDSSFLFLHPFLCACVFIKHLSFNLFGLFLIFPSCLFTFFLFLSYNSFVCSASFFCLFFLSFFLLFVFIQSFY